MMAAQKNHILLRGELRLDEPMSRHTSWRAGGKAQRWYRPADEQDLVEFLQSIPAQEPLYWVGLGSNLLVRDGGVLGTVISTFGVFPALTQQGSTVLQAGAGVTCAKVARFAAECGLTGCEFLVGIPGTLGGALAMNAGAFGGATWERVIEVDTLDRFGSRRTRLPEDYKIGYRQVDGPQGECFTAARLKLEKGDSKQSQASIKELLAQRNQTQPTQQASCGSVFRHPPGNYAAKLVESAGLKGRSVGGACVSEKHANFIVNTGNATANDIENLVMEVQQEVEQKHGILLELEVRIVGERGPTSGGPTNEGAV